jgi:hypothetical protein
LTLLAYFTPSSFGARSSFLQSTHPLGDEKTIVASDRHAAARLEWYSDFDLMDIPPLLTPRVASNDVKRLLEELALLCPLDSAEKLQGLATEQTHYMKFQLWLEREKRLAESGTNPVVEDAASYVKLSHEARLEQIKVHSATLSATSSIGLVTTGIMRIFENAEGLFTGDVDALDLLMRDNVLTEIYNAVSFGFGDFVRSLAITKPNLRILEVGAGIGRMTELILNWRSIVVIQHIRYTPLLTFPPGFSLRRGKYSLTPLKRTIRSSTSRKVLSSKALKPGLTILS